MSFDEHADTLTSGRASCDNSVLAVLVDKPIEVRDGYVSKQMKEYSLAAITEAIAFVLIFVKLCLLKSF